MNREFKEKEYCLKKTKTKNELYLCSAELSLENLVF